MFDAFHSQHIIYSLQNNNYVKTFKWNVWLPNKIDSLLRREIE